MDLYDEKTEAELLVTLSLLECDIALTTHKLYDGWTSVEYIQR